MRQQLEKEIYFYTTPTAQPVFSSLPPPRIAVLFPTAVRASFRALPAMISKGFLVKPKRGHSNNTQGHWWEPMSLPVIFHLFVELTTVAGGRELGASSHVMSQTHARGL